LPSGFARATVRRVQQQRRMRLRVRSALLTAAILFLVVNADRGLDLLRTEPIRASTNAVSSQDSAEWARQRMGVDL